MSRLVRYSTAWCILGIVKSRTFCIDSKNQGQMILLTSQQIHFLLKALTRSKRWLNHKRRGSISGSLPKISHIFRSWYIDVGSEPWNLFLTCLLAIVGLKSISGDPLPKTILSSSLAESSWWDHITRI